MRTATVNYNVYKYNELSKVAKEKVKQWYLEGRESFFFTEDCEQDLENLFGKNNLKVQYSLGYCQGDGFNIYGDIDAENIFNCLDNHNGGTQLKKYENALTDKEKRTILKYAEECGTIKLPYNNHYCYSLACRIDIVNEWLYDLENACYKNIDVEVLEKFEGLVRGIFGKLCKNYEEQGYDYFYEISDEELEDTCEANEYEFLEDGTIF